MATTTGSVDVSHTSDATFRAWAQKLDSVIRTFLTDTAATGQVDLTTMTRPATNTYAGYKVYRFADALQATYPIFLKIEYGTGTVAANGEVRISAGTAHDGAGNLTGAQTTSTFRLLEIGSTSTYTYYASGGSGRLNLLWAANNDGTQYTGQFLGMERTKDASGADDGTGVVLTFGGRGGNADVWRCIVIPPSNGIPTNETRLMFPFPRVSPSTYDSKQAIGLLVPFAGQALRPLIGWGAMNATDAPVYTATISVTVYGTSRTYLSLGTNRWTNNWVDGTNTNPPNACRGLMLYE